MDGKCRCRWCTMKNPIYVEYHDKEWGIPNFDDHYLYEMLILESFQAGLSWECVLNKRESFRKAYDYFIKAVQTEEFPMCGMDESTVDYIIAVLAMEFGDYFDASKLLSKLITSYSATNRLKDRARDAKEELARRMKEAGVEA